MITVNTLAAIASDIYKKNDSKERNLCLSHQRLDATFRNVSKTGFQGAIYQSDKDTVVAIRGTASSGGLSADTKLAFRVKPKQVADADELYQEGLNLHANKPGTLVVVGHSLGGYLTQAICGRYGAWGCTFNAAGARHLFSGRILGLGKYFANNKLAIADEKVLNITIMGDFVSGKVAGKRVGKKIHLLSGKIVNAHFMGTVKQAVKDSQYGEMDLFQALTKAQSAKSSGT